MGQRHTAGHAGVWLSAMAVAAALTILTPAVQARQVWSGIRPNWTDLETWSRPSSDARDTDMGVGLHLSGTGGTMLVSFSARMSARSTSGPADVLVTAASPFNSNPNIVRTAVLGFVLEIEDLVKKTKEQKVVDLSSKLNVDNVGTGNTVQNGVANMSSDQFVSMTKASRIAGRIFGVDVEFRQDQIKAIQTFGEKIKLKR